MSILSDHPTHPATVHFPISFFTLAYALDFLYSATATLRIPYLVHHLDSSLTDISRASFYLHGLGIVTAVPAMLTGTWQFLAMIVSKGGIFESDGKTLRAKAKLTLMHAFISILVLAVSVYSWWRRKGISGMSPQTTDTMISAVAVPLLFVTVIIGGTLTYNYGVGMTISKPSGKKN